MFMAANMVTGPLAGVACCTALAGAAYAFRKRIPHPAECGLIGQCCLACKCHHHSKFNLLISVHEAENLPKAAKVYLYVEAGRFDAQTQDCKVDEKTGKGEIHERLNLHVRQVDDVVKFTVYKKLVLSSDEIGSIELDIVRDLIDEDFPVNKWYQLTKDGKNVSRIQMSFIKLEGEYADMSPLLLQALITEQNAAIADGREVADINFGTMQPKEKLVFLSKALEGPLKMMKGIGLKSWTACYVKLVEVKKDDWEWQYWKDKKSCKEGGKKLGRMRMLGVSNVLPDPGSRHQFYVKYHDVKGSHDYMFLRMDRDRDVWSDGLYEFLSRLRDYLEKYRGPSSTAQDYIEGKKKKGHKKMKPGTRRPSFDPNVRRVRAVKVGEEPTAPRPPKALVALAAEMYTSEEEGDDEGSDGEASEGGEVVQDGGTGSSMEHGKKND